MLHGLPGTGKTTFLRSLASPWLPWCRLGYVLDSDVLFANSSSLFGAVLRPDDDDSDDPDEPREAVARLRMLVIEDCDELLRADVKERSGQALSLLLNLADGAVGQGQRLIMCLTTNEPIHRLHPALVRRAGASPRSRWAASIGRPPSPGCSSAALPPTLLALRSGPRARRSPSCMPSLARCRDRGERVGGASRSVPF